MRLAKLLRDQKVKALAYDIGCRVTEHLLGGGVEEHDALVLINGDNPVHR